MCFTQETIDELYELIKKAREVTGDYHIMYVLDSGISLDDFREHLLKIIEKAEHQHADNDLKN